MFTANEDITASSFLNTPANESHAALPAVAYAVTTARTSSTFSFDNGVNMTRKDYQLIADAIQAAFRTPWLRSTPHADAHIECARRAVVSEISEALYRENPRFDRARFAAACADQNGTEVS